MCIDIGKKIFVTVGGDAPGKEKKDAMIMAQNFLKDSGKKIYTPIIKVSEGQNPNDELWDTVFRCMAAMLLKIVYVCRVGCLVDDR